MTDAITEMLASPLRLLSYLNLRARFGDKFLANHEHTLLSHHLKRNLWLDSDTDLMLLHDDILVHLDIAMAVRRDGVSGAATPDGHPDSFRSNALWADYREHRG